MPWSTIKDLVTTIVSIASLIIAIIKEGPHISRIMRNRNKAKTIKEDVSQIKSAHPSEKQLNINVNQKETKDDSSEDDIFMHLYYLCLILSGPVASLIWSMLRPANIWMGILIGIGAFVVIAQLFYAVFDLTFFGLRLMWSVEKNWKNFLSSLVQNRLAYALTLTIMYAIIGGLWGAATFGVSTMLGGADYAGSLLCGGGSAFIFLYSYFYSLGQKDDERRKRKALFIYEFIAPSDVVDARGQIKDITYLQWMEDAAMRHFQHFGALHPVQDIKAKWKIRSHTIKYIIPASAGDQIKIKTWVMDIYSRNLEMEYSFLRKTDEKALAQGKMDWELVDSETGHPIKIPKQIKKIISVMPTPNR
jgi:acyl-CoA thioester hydrolase